MKKSGVVILLCLFASFSLRAEEKQDTIAVYQGTQLKVDIGSTILEVARSSGQVQTYEIGANVNLKQRYFPTLEAGYAQAYRVADGGTFDGRGGFGRVGLDLSVLKKKKESPHKLLVGIRVGTAVQNYQMTNLTVYDNYWQQATALNTGKILRADVWGEVVVGIQVQVYKQFYMGLAARLKILMTRGKEGDFTAYYIPGYGYKDDMNFGFNYYLGIGF